MGRSRNVQVNGFRQVLRCRYAPSPQYDMLLKYQLPGTNDMEELVSLENNEDLDNFKVSLFVKRDKLRRATQAWQI